MHIKSAVYEGFRSRNKPSLFAAPLAWATGDFLQGLIQEAGEIVPAETGMIVVSDECSLDTVRGLAATAAQGDLSPLRFAGASPGIVVGLPALQQGIRGPTLTLTMLPDHAVEAIVALVAYWLKHNGIGAVIVLAHHRHSTSSHLLKGLIVRPAEVELRRRVEQLCRAESTESAKPA